MTSDRSHVIHQLRTEIAALEGRMDSKNHLIESLREQLHDHETRSVDERRTQIFRRAARDIVDDHSSVEFSTPPPLIMQDMGDALVELGSRLDYKFAEVKALSEITEEINAGVFLDEVLDHVFDGFDALIPYDRIGVALIEKEGTGNEIVRSQWSRSRYESDSISNGYSARLAGSSLAQVAKSGHPRILNDLKEYYDGKPESNSTRLILKEGVRSSLTCPLIARGKAIGFIFFSSREAGTYKNQHIDLFLQIAGELALALEKSKAYEELYLKNEFITRVFGQYVTDEVAELVLRDENQLSLGGERRLVTILMADIRGFTPMSEAYEPEEVVETLNTFLGGMTEIIMKYGGSVDNFIGDAVMAVFGLPTEKPDDAGRAAACSVEMQGRMASINEHNVDRGLPPIEMGIGLNTGEVVAGNIGSDKRMKYSVIGSPVNVAARIQGLASGGQIFASATTIDRAGPDVLTCGHLNVKMKGLDRPVPIYEIEGMVEVKHLAVV